MIQHQEIGWKKTQTRPPAPKHAMTESTLWAEGRLNTEHSIAYMEGIP